MRHALVLACSVLALSLACAHKQSAVQTTAASMKPDESRRTDEPELTLAGAATRLASQFCAREVRCHDAHELMGPCMEKYLRRARLELTTWQCAPAAVRSRLKACFAAIETEPCATNVALRARFCETNDKCPDPDARLIPPGAAVAAFGALRQMVREEEQQEQRRQEQRNAR
jgi:hypothetical protein